MGIGSKYKQNNPFLCLVYLVCSLLFSQSLFASAVCVGTKEISFKIPNTNRWLVAEIYYPTNLTHENSRVNHGIWIRQSFIKDAPLSPHSLPFPLVIFSHGWQGDRFGNSWIAESLVAKGYIVAMIDHTHNTSYEHDDLYVYTDLWQRPQDLSHLLTYLLQKSKWKKNIDKERIAAGGFSLGGLTALWLGGIQADPHLFKEVMDQKYARWSDWPQSAKTKAQKVNWTKAKKSFYDPRIKAIFAIAPDLGQAFSPQGLEIGKTPLLILVGDKDLVTPAHENASFYATHIPHAKLITLKDASHFSFMNRCSELGQKLTPHLCQDTQDRHLHHDQCSQYIIEFLDDIFKSYAHK